MSKHDLVVVGKEGETVVAEYFRGIDREVLTHDWYDTEKDLTIDGKRIEVKSQVPYVNENAFTLKKVDSRGKPSNDWPKCTQADYTVFVSIPNKRRPHKSENKIFIIKGSDLLLNYREKRTSDGRVMYLIPIYQKNMHYLCDLPEESSQLMQEKSQSTWAR